MKNNRCFKWTALLLMTILGISLFLTPALANDEVGWGGLVLPQATLTEKFIESVIITDSSNTEITDLESADPNDTFTLTISVKQPADASANTDQLPQNTDESPMTYALKSMSAITGHNDDVSWTYNPTTKHLVFEWVNGKKDAFTAGITVVPEYRETLGLNGKSYLIVAQTKNGNGVVLPRQKSDYPTRLMAENGATFDSEGKLIHGIKDDPMWLFTHVSGDWYTISCNGLYLHIDGNSATVSQEPTALKVSENGGIYEIGNYKKFRLNAKGTNPTNGMQGYNGESPLKLYSSEQISKKGTLGLGEKDFYIGNFTKDNDIYRNIVLPWAKSSKNGMLAAAPYNEKDSNTIIPQGTYVKWHFENAGKNYYYIKYNGQYMMLTSGGAALTSTPTKLLVMTNGNGYYSIMDDSPALGQVLELDCCYSDKNIGGAFQGYLNAGKRYKIRLYENAEDTEYTSLTGNWAIINPETKKAILDTTFDNGSLQAIDYTAGDQTGTVKAVKEGMYITSWQFRNAGKPNWYYISNEAGLYLKVTGSTVSLSTQQASVYIQKTNNDLIRITDGETNAINISYFAGNNTLISYSDRGSHERMSVTKAQGIPEWIEYPLYNMIKIGDRFYRMKKTTIQVQKSLEDYLIGKKKGEDNVLQESEYVVDEYEFGDITMADGTVYVYRPNDYEPDETETINYYKATFSNMTVVKQKIGGIKNGVTYWLNGEQLYDEPNETDSFHRNYELQTFKHVGIFEQPLMNMLKIDRGDNNYYRLKIGTIIAKDAQTKPYEYGKDVDASKVTVDDSYDFTNVVININGIDYVYSDHVIEGNHPSYFTVSYKRITLQNRVNGEDSWYRNPMGFLDGSQVQYANIENQTVAYHRDYIAKLYKGNMPEYGVTISSSLEGKAEVPAGTMITLTGTPIGFENTPYTIHWERKNPATGETEVIEGQNSLTYTFPITEETAKYDYYIILTPIE